MKRLKIKNKKINEAKKDKVLTPSFYNWLKTFHAKYKNALTELAKR